MKRLALIGEIVDLRIRLLPLTVLLALALAGCNISDLGAPAATATVPPLPTSTSVPSATATDSPVPTVTETSAPAQTPSATYTLSPTFTPTYTSAPTATPTTFAVVRSQRRVNVRGGPGTDHDIVDSVASGAAVQVLAESEDSNWYRVQLDSGREGWISAALLRVAFPPTSAPQSVTLTSVASATPTARSTDESAEPIGAATTVDEAQAIAEAERQDNQLVINVPIVDLQSINQTATALVGAAAGRTPPAQAEDRVPTEDQPPPATTDVESIEVPTREPAAPRSGVDVFAFCNNQTYRIPAPANLTAGSTIEIFWAWFASTENYLRQHISNSTHELRINGTQIANVDQFRGAPTKRGNDHVVYWYVPYGPLEAGSYRITYRVTWRSAISDGYKAYGPGTSTEFEEESCSFVVR